ncbi:uncharacterized protein LOC133030310 [Cannabis sativa]|uniref:uncharacterized protein LOC133030310 n=1 Tax=Cannabis sativa TaxID=3483 RepID=UPI0029CA26EC|nr:uncharacterized protein LOC133030310 [Cannabis sativa]
MVSTRRTNYEEEDHDDPMNEGNTMEHHEEYQPVEPAGEGTSRRPGKQAIPDDEGRVQDAGSSSSPSHGVRRTTNVHEVYMENEALRQRLEETLRLSKEWQESEKGTTPWESFKTLPPEGQERSRSPTTQGRDASAIPQRPSRENDNHGGRSERPPSQQRPRVTTSGRENRRNNVRPPTQQQTRRDARGPTAPQDNAVDPPRGDSREERGTTHNNGIPSSQPLPAPRDIGVDERGRDHVWNPPSPIRFPPSPIRHPEPPRTNAQAPHQPAPRERSRQREAPPSRLPSQDLPRPPQNGQEDYRDNHARQVPQPRGYGRERQRTISRDNYVCPRPAPRETRPQRARPYSPRDDSYLSRSRTAATQSYAQQRPAPRGPQQQRTVSFMGESYRSDSRSRSREAPYRAEYDIPPQQGEYAPQLNVNAPPPAGLNAPAPVVNDPRITALEQQIQQLMNAQGSVGGYDSDEEPEPFAPHISALPYPQGFKMPTMTKYDGSTDPGAHISDFNTLMRTSQVSGDLKCMLFPVTLTGAGKTWFNKWKKHSITSWDKLSSDFKKEFRAARSRKPECSSLANVKQQPGESLKAYINRFNIEAAKVKNVDDSGRLMALGAGITHGSLLWDSLQGRGAPTIDEFMKRAQKYINIEEARLANNLPLPSGQPVSATTTTTSTNPKATTANPPTTNNSGHNNKRKGDNGGDQNNAKKSKGYQSMFTIYSELVETQETIYVANEHRVAFRIPEPLKGSGAKRDPSKYCQYHKDIGHTTNECRNLRDEIKTLIRNGPLAHYARNRQYNQQGANAQQHVAPRANVQPQGAPGNNTPNPPTQPQGGQLGHNPDIPPLVEGEDVLVISGGPHFAGITNGAQKRYINELKNSDKTPFTPEQRAPKQSRMEDQTITFSNEDAHHVQSPHNDPLVITSQIANRRVRRVLVDNGSSVNLLYKITLEKMGLSVQDLQPCTTNLVGFTGDGVASTGKITLPLTLGEAPKTVTRMTEFVVVDLPSAYNAILGRPALYTLGAVTSIKHLALKFPTATGSGIVKGDQLPARECYNVAMRGQTRPGAQMLVVNNDNEVENRGARESSDIEEIDPRLGDDRIDLGPIEELEEVTLNLKEPTKTVKVGKHLSKEIKKAVIQFLRDNQEVFAWAHSDMVGISPNVMTHVLNLNKDVPAKRQKRRLLDEVRAVALKEEVSKLLANNFIREAFYPVWVANPVLVPKPNGKWRTCINFTDLNKACPKDCFPLPRIDQLVDATAGHELMSFMDAYSGYNQIPMNVADQEHTSFTTDMGLYCYNVMPFGLKNVGATYQ